MTSCCRKKELNFNVSRFFLINKILLKEASFCRSKFVTNNNIAIKFLPVSTLWGYQNGKHVIELRFWDEVVDNKQYFRRQKRSRWALAMVKFGNCSKQKKTMLWSIKKVIRCSRKRLWKSKTKKMIFTCNKCKEFYRKLSQNYLNWVTREAKCFCRRYLTLEQVGKWSK